MPGDIATPMIVMPSMFGAAVAFASIGISVYAGKNNDPERKIKLRTLSINSARVAATSLVSVALAEYLLTFVGGYILQIMLFFAALLAIPILFAVAIAAACLSYLDNRPDLREKMVKWWTTNPNDIRR